MDMLYDLEFSKLLYITKVNSKKTRKEKISLIMKGNKNKKGKFKYGK